MLTNPFFGSRSQIVELARRRYFEDGIAPAGAVSDAVFQSWARCQRLHDRPEGPVEFEPVTQSRAQLALQRNRPLVEAWQAEVPILQQLLGTSSCAAMLTDGTGVLIGAACAGRPHERLMPVATRVGVDLSEEAVGTTAPGIVVRIGRPVCVLGSEHFFDQVRHMQCAAAPIRDTQGGLAGVLDISSESIEFAFDALAVVGHLAATLENRLLIAQSADHLILRIQVAPTLLDASTVGLVGVRPDGRVTWLNGVAASLLGMATIGGTRAPPHVESILGQNFGALASLPHEGAATLALPSGLSLWVRRERRGMAGRGDGAQLAVQGLQERRDVPARCAPLMDAVCAQESPLPPPPDGLQISAALPCPEDAPAVEPGQRPASEVRLSTPSVQQTVQTIHHDLLQKALHESSGNLSKAARRLGVSRGWIYRRILAASPNC